MVLDAVDHDGLFHNIVGVVGVGILIFLIFSFIIVVLFGNSCYLCNVGAI